MIGGLGEEDAVGVSWEGEGGGIGDTKEIKGEVGVEKARVSVGRMGESVEVDEGCMVVNILVKVNGRIET